MKMRLFAVAVLALAGSSGLSMGDSALAAPHAAVADDWTRTVALTPDGGFRMGSPAAKVKLVEYGSLTCPHCANFSATAMPGLKSYVRSGKVSYEYRNFVLNGIDVTATLLARCGGANGFFAITEAMFASQPQWLGSVAAMTADQKREIGTLPVAQKLDRIADVAGLRQLAAKGGVTPKQAQQCLSRDAAMDELQRMRQRGTDLGVEGTPTFFINGEKLKAFTWADLEPDIRNAVGGGG
jgi:protein-disulfide isomerase